MMKLSMRKNKTIKGNWKDKKNRKMKRKKLLKMEIWKSQLSPLKKMVKKLLMEWKMMRPNPFNRSIITISMVKIPFILFIYKK